LNNLNPFERLLYRQNAVQRPRSYRRRHGRRRIRWRVSG
jgi:hypothetical protein